MPTSIERKLRNSRIVRDVLKGTPLTEIAQREALTLGTIQAIVNANEAEIEAEMSQRNQLVSRDMREKVIRAHTKLIENSEPAVEVLVETMGEEDPRLALSAAESILDRVGLGRKNKVSDNLMLGSTHDSEEPPPQLSQDEVEEVKLLLETLKKYHRSKVIDVKAIEAERPHLVPER